MIQATEKRKKIKYPALMEYDSMGVHYVVLMTHHGVGTVVKTNTKEYPIGMYDDLWKTNRGTMSLFKEYEGIIELKNK